MQAAEQRVNIKELVTDEIGKNEPRPVEDIAFKKPIILGGCGSSGTTLLKTMFDAHGKIACGPEISIFDRPMLYRTDLDELHNMFKQQSFDRLERNLHFPVVTRIGTYFGLFAPNAGKQYHDFATIDKIFQISKNLRHFIDLFFSNYAKNQDKTRWAEKTPNNIFCVDQVLDLLPDAKFIHVIRDGRDVVLSLTEKRKFDLRMAVYRWLISVEAGLRNRGHERYYEVKYEDLILDTENTLRKLMDFLEEDFDPAMLKFWEKGKDNFKGYGSTPIFTDSIGKWKKERSNPTILEHLDLMLADKLNKLGYET